MHTEQELVTPAVSTIRAHGGECSTGDLISYLRTTLPLDDEDRELLPSGGQERFDRTVGNLRSHDTLLKMGLVTYSEIGYVLTEKGLSLATEEIDIAAVRHFSAKSNTLSLQQTMVKYVREIAQIQFVSDMKAAGAIMKKLKTLPTYKNDNDRMDAVAQVVDDYVLTNPNMVNPK
jgi:hypothetical protein